MFFSVMILTWKLFQITKISTFTHRSSRQEMFCIKGVLRNLTKLTGKHLCQRLVFNKVAGLRPATLLKKSLWNKCFASNFAKFLRTPFFYRTSPVAASANMINSPKFNEMWKAELYSAYWIKKEKKANSELLLHF